MGAYARSDDLAKQQLTVKTFPVFYRRVMKLHFPLDVAEIIDLRDTVKHASEHYGARTRAPSDRRFADAVHAEIRALAIRAPHHVERLVQILLLLRHLYRAHRARSQGAERDLRRRQASNHEARRISSKYGALAFIATAVALFTWIGLGDVGWPVKTVTVLLAYVALDCYFSLSALGRYHERLGRELEGVRNERIRRFDWKPLLHKLALILGYTRPLDIKAVIASLEESGAFDLPAEPEIELGRRPRPRAQTPVLR